MLNIENLSFAYSKKDHLFKDLSLELKSGHIYGLLGENGAGKTTLLKHICGLYYPNNGLCRIQGENIAERRPESLQHIYLIPEQFDLPEIKGEMFKEINAAFYSSFDNTLFYNVLSEFQINAENKLSKMSYGQKKKFIIAFGLATRASLLIMDEPTNGLDIPSKSQFRKIVASSISEKQSVLISTHQVRDLSNLIDHVTILQNGRITLNKSLEEISAKLHFGRLPDDSSEIIYQEDTVGAKIGVALSTGKETEVDLELLFNANLYEEDKIYKALNTLES